MSQTIPGGRNSSKDRRPSLAADALEKAADGITSSSKMLASGERRVSVSSMRLRSAMEMWLMDEVPKLCGCENDPEKMGEDMSEDAQSGFVQSILFEKAETELNDNEIKDKIKETFGNKKDLDATKYAAFEATLMQKVKDALEAFSNARKQSKEVPRESVKEPAIPEGAEEE